MTFEFVSSFVFFSVDYDTGNLHALGIVMSLYFRISVLSIEEYHSLTRKEENIADLLCMDSGRWGQSLIAFLPFMVGAGFFL